MLLSVNVSLFGTPIYIIQTTFYHVTRGKSKPYGFPIARNIATCPGPGVHGVERKKGRGNPRLVLEN